MFSPYANPFCPLTSRILFPTSKKESSVQTFQRASASPHLIKSVKREMQFFLAAKLSDILILMSS
jgi:LytS/YehU family sensor histidine kinase